MEQAGCVSGTERCIACLSLSSVHKNPAPYKKLKLGQTAAVPRIPASVMGEVEAEHPFLYRVSDEREWKTATADGQLVGGDLDRASGFIHLSTFSQVKGVLELFFSGRNDLYLLKIDAAKLGAGLRYERVEEVGQEFPHFYGPGGTFAPIPLSLVVEWKKLQLSEGKHVLAP